MDIDIIDEDELVQMELEGGVEHFLTVVAAYIIIAAETIPQFPLQSLGVIDVAATEVTDNEILAHAL